MPQASDPAAGGAQIDVKQFWNLMAVRPVAVPIVAASDAHGPAGLLALSVSHVSATPPIMSVAVGHSTSALATIRNAASFSINYLPEDESQTAEIFGGRRNIDGPDRFSDGRWTALRTGAPIFINAALALDCIVEKVLEYGETDLFLGRIVDHRLDRTRLPLISFQGRFAGLETK